MLNETAMLLTQISIAASIPITIYFTPLKPVMQLKLKDKPLPIGNLVTPKVLKPSITRYHIKQLSVVAVGVIAYYGAFLQYLGQLS